MAFVRVEQRNAHLAGSVKLEYFNGREGKVAKGLVTAISKSRHSLRTHLLPIFAQRDVIYTGRPRQCIVLARRTHLEGGPGDQVGVFDHQLCGISSPMRLAGCSGRRSDAIAVAGALTICWSECGSVWGLRKAACVGRPFLAETSPSLLRPTADLAITARRDHRKTTLKRGARCLVGSLRQIGRTDNAQLALAAGLRQRDFTSIAACLVSGAT